MSNQRRGIHHVIAEMMESTSVALGPGMASQSDMPQVDTSMDDVNASVVDDNNGYSDELEGFSEAELKLGRRFIELLGDPERARELIDKCSEGMEFLGMLDNEEEKRTSDHIRHMAGLMPDDPDLPMSIRNQNGLANLYNPSAMNGH